jgi:hypothetical protein
MFESGIDVDFSCSLADTIQDDVQEDESARSSDAIAREKHCFALSSELVLMIDTYLQ